MTRRPCLALCLFDGMEEDDDMAVCAELETVRHRAHSSPREIVGRPSPLQADKSFFCSEPDEFVCVTPCPDEASANTTPEMPPAPSRPLRHHAELLKESKILFEVDESTSHYPMSTPTLGTSPPLNEPTLFKEEDKFEFLGVLGQGAFSDVWAARHKASSQLYALKRSKREFRGLKDRELLLKEIRSVAALPDCDNIVKYYRAWQTDAILWTQMEYCSGGTLQAVLDAHQGPIGALWARKYMKDILTGIKAMHAHGLLHLDLKPANIFISEGRVKIGDFGLATTAEEWSGTEGDRIFLARELFQNIASPAADIFAAGLILYQMVCAKTLPAMGEEWHKIRHGSIFFPQDCHPAAKDLIKAMLHPIWQLRPSAELALKSQFFTNADSDEPKADLFARRVKRSRCGSPGG